MGYSNLVTHPITKPAKQDLTLLIRRNTVQIVNPRWFYTIFTYFLNVPIERQFLCSVRYYNSDCFSQLNYRIDSQDRKIRPYIKDSLMANTGLEKPVRRLVPPSNPKSLPK